MRHYRYSVSCFLEQAAQKECERRVRFQRFSGAELCFDVTQTATYGNNVAYAAAELDASRCMGGPSTWC